MTFSATDNVGIRRAEIVDVTDAANPSVVAAEDYTSTATAPERALHFTQAAPVPRPQERDDRRRRPRSPASARCCCASPTPPATRPSRRPSPSRRAARSTARAAATARAWSPASPATRSAAAARRASRSACCARPRPSAGATAPRCAGILRNAAGQPVAGAELRLLVRELRLGVALRRSRRGHDRRRRALHLPHPARLLAALPARLPRLPGRRRTDRQVRRQLQHQGADHHPRAPPRPLARERALPRQPRPAARCPRAA